MDHINLKILQGYRTDDFSGELKLLMKYKQGAHDGNMQIPAPYKEDESQFSVVLNKIHDSCLGLISYIKTENPDILPKR